MSSTTMTYTREHHFADSIKKFASSGKTLPPEDQIVGHFTKCLGPFNRYREMHWPGRSNFLPYGYVLDKICTLLGYPGCVDYSMSAGKKLEECDACWAYICSENGWPLDEGKQTESNQVQATWWSRWSDMEWSGFVVCCLVSCLLLGVTRAFDAYSK